MDVTALLNRNTFAVKQQKEDAERLRLPTRSRTPWDAGGYSLPIHATCPNTSPDLDRPFDVHQSSSEPINGSADDSRNHSIPKSPTHWFSDSRSSISSISSSAHSTTDSAAHSRFSSFSTVNSNQSLSNSRTAQSLSPKSIFIEPQLVRMSTVLLPWTDTQPSKSNDFQARSDFPRSSSIDPLAIIAESQKIEYLANSPGHATQANESDSEHRGMVTGDQRLLLNELILEDSKNSVDGSLVSHVDRSSEQTQPVGEIHGIDRGLDQDTNRGTKEMTWGSKLQRPTSPSDTLLIKRNIITPIRDDSIKHSIGGEQSLELHHHSSYWRADSGIHREELSNFKGHKRALSAPSFALQRNNSAIIISRSRGRKIGYTPPLVEQPDPSPPESYSYSAPDTPPPATIEEAENEPVCMYIEDCDTGSQQRKAISHIFGRNKMCTRLIPQHVWVHLCRKHYQRSRYRNATAGYAKVQCDLVQEQIRRIHDWSERNQQNGRGAYVQNWTLALRKREQKRIEEQDAPKRKRANLDQGEEDEVNRDQVGYPTPQTAVPDWLLAQVGGEFSTIAVLDIFSRLHQHIIDYTVPFPDIELLPNVVLNKEEEKNVATKNSHQRAQSLSINHESSFRDHVPKRRRQHDGLSSENHSPRLSRRPTCPGIIEHEADDTKYPDQRSFYQTPFRGPVIQRRNSQAMITYVESSNLRDRADVRPTHHRAHSDMSSFSRSPFMYSSRFLDENRSHVSRSYQSHVQLPEELGIHAHRARSMKLYGQYSEDVAVHAPRGGQSYGTGSSANPFSDVRALNQSHTYNVMDPLLPAVRDRSQTTKLGHSRHFSSPAIPRPSYSMPHIRDTSQSYTPRSTYAQSNKLTHTISEFREPSEFYSGRQ